MLGFIFLITAFFLGLALVRRLPFATFRAEKVALSIVFGFLLAIWLLWLTAWAVGHTIGLPFAIGLNLAGILLLWRGVTTLHDLQLNFRDYTIWLLLTWLSITGFGTLLYQHMLQVGEAGWYSAGATWGDLALHMNLISYFADHNNFSFTFPTLINTKLTYPFLFDYLSSVLYRTGSSYQISLIVPGFLVLVSFIQLLFFFALRLTKRVWVGIFATILFLFSGSYAGLSRAYLDWRSSGQSLLNFLNHLPHDYSNLPEQGLQFTNVITTLLMPQRGFQFAFALVMGLLLLLHQAWHEKLSTRWILGIGLAIGLLPFVHAHTFIVLILIFGWLAVVKSWQAKVLVKSWWQGVGLALLVALPQLIWQMKANVLTGFGYWHLGWVVKPGDSILIFWLRNLGPFMLVWLVLLAKRRFRDQFSYQVLAALGVIFLIANLYIFQPYDYDNLKLLIYCFLGLVLFVGYLLARALEFRLGWLVVVVFLPLLSGTGMLAVRKESQSSYLFLTNQEIDLASQIRTVVPAEKSILIADQHNHPLMVLGGRQIMLGYRGWLWSYGLSYQEIEKDAHHIFAGDNEADSLIKKYELDYMLIGPRERLEWQGNDTYALAHYSRVLQGEGWNLYRLRP